MWSKGSVDAHTLTVREPICDLLDGATGICCQLFLLCETGLGVQDVEDGPQ